MYKILSLLWPILLDGIGNKSQSRDKILYILATSVCILRNYDGS